MMLTLTAKTGKKYPNVKILVSEMKIKSQLNRDGVNKCRSQHELACLLCPVQEEGCVSFHAGHILLLAHPSDRPVNVSCFLWLPQALPRPFRVMLQ